ncbi:MAG: UMP kinase [Bacteroidia bacterium]|nr:MAG: UMP kinase [Bacteroidia bacterium]
MNSKYKRVLLKLSGQSLKGNLESGIDYQVLLSYTSQIKEVVEMGVEVGIVIGGGNIFRGQSGSDLGFDRVKGDYMGMFATMINGLALQSGFENIGQTAHLFTAFNTEPAGERYSQAKAIHALNNKHIAIITGGTGNPYFSTDSASALRALEIKADIILKGTRVDGVYTSDPEKNPDAKKIKQISYEEIIEKELKVMDLTAFTLCRENKIPLYVFDMDTPGNLKKVLLGEEIGTMIS